MTLNQIVQRVRKISLAHQQIRTFERGQIVDFLNEKTTKYPAVFLQGSTGSISTAAKATTLNYRIFFVDLVHVAADAKDNELDVHSDMINIAMDVIAQMNNGNYDDWVLSTDNSLQLLVEENGDMYAGVYVDFSLRTMFKQNVCEVPSELTYDIIDTDMKFVYDEIYKTTGSEGNTVTLPALQGKKVLFIVRENAPLHRVSNSPDEAEYTWDGNSIVMGTVLGAGERLLILYRNY